MGLEAATWIDQLNASWPIGGVDPKAQGDDNLRMLKAVLQAHFNSLGHTALSVTAAQINTVVASGITGFGTPGANKVGIGAPVAGVALTAMRSDATLQLDQGISPTWSGIHAFTGAIKTSRISPARFVWEVTNGGVDAKIWEMRGESGNIFTGQTRNDADNAGKTWLTVTRAATAIASINMGQTTDNPTFSWLGTGLFTLGGALVVTSTAQTPALNIFAAQPILRMNETGAGVDLKNWDFTVSGTVLQCRTRTDADAAGASWLNVRRGATTAIASVEFPATVPLLTALGIHNGTATGGPAAPALASGTWNPTLTNVANTSALANKGAWNWTRVGNVVHFSGQFDFTPAALVRSQVRVSLPIASNFTQQFQATGLMAPTTGTASTQPLWANGGTVSAVTATDDLLVDFVETINTTAKTAFVHGQYLIV